MGRGGVVAFDVPAQVAYDYLVDPLNRPQWQSSLRTVRLDATSVAERARPGARWRDVTWPGLGPRMELTEAERPVRWTEVGHWHGVEAELTLVFLPDSDADDSASGGCRVRAEFALRLPGPLRPVGPWVTALAVRPVLVDLRRAAVLVRNR